MFRTIISKLKGKLHVSISSAIFLMLSAIIRILALGCFGLAFYVKYSDWKVIGYLEFAAMETIDLYGMPLATYIQGLVFGFITVFVTEAVCGIVGFIAALKQKQNYLIGYICLCLVAILVYITHMVLWYKLHTGISGNNIWWCSSYGWGYDCFAKISVKMKPYIRTYLYVFCVFILLQVANIVAADYTIIKLKLKEKNIHISEQERYILCLKDYGIFPIFWSLLKSYWTRSRMCLFSVVIKSSYIISSIGLVSISIRFISSDFISTVQLLPLFRRIYIHNYSYHDIASGFGSSMLAIGCFGIGVGIIGLIGSKFQSTILQTVSFFMTIMLLMLKIIAVAFSSVMYTQFIESNEYKLYEYAMNRRNYSQGVLAINRLMINFQCCLFYDRQIYYFCLSSMNEGEVNRDFSKSNTILIGYYTNNTKCSNAVESRIMEFARAFLALMVLGILLNSVGLVFTSKEFKESKTKHLIPWLLYIYNKEKGRNRYVVITIIITVLMLMLELSFIVLAAIFSVSNHVNRDFINAIGDFYKFLAISGIVLVVSSIIVRIVGLVGTFNKFRKTLFASTALMVLIAVLNLAYIIMASVLRHDKYPCSYADLTYSNGSQDCSSELLSTSGAAIGMFVTEIVTQIVHLTLFIHDIKTNFRHNRVNTSSIPRMNTTSARSPDDRNMLSETNFD